MRIFPNKSLLNHFGKPCKESDADNAPESKLGTFLSEGFLRDLPSDQGTGEGGKMYRWRAAAKITAFMEKYKGHDHFMDMTTTDVAMVSKRLEQILPTVLLGPVINAIEGEENTATTPTPLEQARAKK